MTPSLSQAVSPPIPAPDPGDQASVREHNLGLVSRCIFEQTQPITRTQIAHRTGLTRATVTRLVDELIDARFVEVLEPVRLRGQGRPARPVIPASRTLAGIGLEVNIDRMAGIALDLRGEEITRFEIDAPVKGADPESVMRQLCEFAALMVNGLKAGGIETTAATLAIPGVISDQKGKLLIAPNLGWHDVPIHDILQAKLGVRCNIPVFAANDANVHAAAVAYSAPGRLRPLNTFLYVAGGAGIGGAVVIEGTTMKGVGGRAGEIGHTCVDMNGPECFCGSTGCLECYVSTEGLLARVGLDPQTSSITDFLEALNLGDLRAKSALDDATNALAVALANATTLLDVPTIVLGTTLATLLPYMEPHLSEMVRQRSLAGEDMDLQIIASPRSNGLPVSCLAGALLSLQAPIENPAEWIATHPPASH